MTQHENNLVCSDFVKLGDPKAEYIIKAAVDQKNKVIIDGGSAMGVYTEKLLNLNCKGLIYCFEPFPRNNSLFRDRIGWPPNVVLFPFALYDKFTTVSFAVERTVHDQNSGIKGYSSLGKIDENNQVNAEERLDVIAAPLHDLVTYPISLLKMDLQGGERAALKGSLKMLDKGLIDCCFMEFNGDRECLRLLRERDYRLYYSVFTAMGDFDENAFPGKILGKGKTTSGLQLVNYAPNFESIDCDELVDIMRAFRRDHAYIQTDIIAIHSSKTEIYLPKGNK